MEGGQPVDRELVLQHDASQIDQITLSQMTSYDAPARDHLLMSNIQTYLLAERGGCFHGEMLTCFRAIQDGNMNIFCSCFDSLWTFHFLFSRSECEDSLSLLKKVWTVSPDHWLNSSWVSSCATNCYSAPALSVWTDHHLVCRLPTEHAIELTIQFHSRTRPRETHRNNNKTTRYLINS